MGTKNWDYLFPLDNMWMGKIYEIRDLNANSLEKGVKFERKEEGSSRFIIKLSYLQKDNLLDQSILAKLYWVFNRSLRGTNLESRYAIGYLRFPSMYSDWTDFKASAVDTPSVYTSQIFSNHFGNIDWYAGMRLNLSTDALYNPNASYDMFSLSHLDGVWGAFVKRPLIFGQTGIISYAGIIRTSSWFPEDYFQNQEIGTGIESQNLSVKYYYPLKFEFRRQDYPFQDKRIEAEMHFPFIFGTRLDLSLISQYQDLYRAMCSRNYGDVNAGIYLSKNYQEKQIGIQISLSQDNYKALEDFYLSRENIPADRQVPIIYADTLISDNAMENASELDQLSNILKMPWDVCYYTSKFINYTYEHNSLSAGWSNLFAPQEVFLLKKGNCTEQASFQQYLLNKNGYETAILGTLARDFFHAILVYRDPASGKWNAIDNAGSYKMYFTRADSYEELITKVFPGWFSIVVKGQDAKGLYEVDSTTKWYIQDWIEKE
jgi:hypothetical protein